MDWCRDSGNFDGCRDIRNADWYRNNCEEGGIVLMSEEADTRSILLDMTTNTNMLGLFLGPKQKYEPPLCSLMIG
jgi:hypothetical protein